MTDADAPLAALLRSLAEAVADLVPFVTTPRGVAVLLSEAGHPVPAGSDLGAALTRLRPVADGLATLAAAVAGPAPGPSGGSPGDGEGDLAAVAAALVEVVEGVAALAEGPVPGSLPAPWDDAEAWEQLAASVLGHVVHDRLRARAPRLLSTLELLGVARPQVLDDLGVSVVEPGVVLWQAIPQLLSDPVGHLRQTYAWGTAPDVTLLVAAVRRAVDALGLPVTLLLADDVVERLWDVTADDPPVAVPGLTAAFPFTQGSGELRSREVVSLSVLGVPDASRRGPLAGVALVAEASGAVTAAVPLTDAVTLTLAGALEGGVVLTVRPGAVGLTTSTGASVGGEVGATVVGRPAQPWTFGDPHGTRVSASRVAAAVTARAGTPGPAPELVVGVDADVAVVLDLSAGDGFVTALLGGEAHEVSFTAGLVWSSRTGLRLVGGAAGGAGHGLSTTVPLDVDLAGVLHLSGLELGTGPAGQGAVVEARATGRLSLGPFTVTFAGLGVALQVDAPASGAGNLGPLDVRFGLVGPRAVGLAIDAAAVSGGGYLEVDPQTGTYVGVAQLTILGTVSVTAIGIITTRLPDGRDGFALLLLITAEGFTPVQLGLGFTLTGIGGLLALNRTVDADAVRSGLRDGILDSVLFVKDPVKNADRVVSTLDRVFPVARDRLVVGPLAEISWGTPAIVHLRLALLLDLPNPVRAVVLAALSVALPEPEAPVVEIHVDAIGVLDLGRGQLALDASLHDSRLLSFTLSGDLALRLDWGREPGFLLSVGGFHPRFRPPAGLRPLNRLALQLTSSRNPTVRFEAYLAVTSNTLQMGARATFALTVGGFGISGGGSFDTLLQWSPFHLEVDVAAWVRVTAGGSTLLSLTLALAVTGPAPWHLTGTAEVHVLFVSVSVHVDLTLGQSATAAGAVDAVDVPALVWERVSRADAWEATLPADVTPGAVVGGAPGSASGGGVAGSGRVLAHPLASVAVRQNLAPLGLRISHVGAHLPARGPVTLGLTLTGPAGTVSRPVTDLFARAQFADVPAEERLAAPSFEAFASGVRLEPAAASSAGPSTPCLALVDTLDLSDLDAPAAPGAPAPALVDAAAGRTA